MCCNCFYVGKKLYSRTELMFVMLDCYTVNRLNIKFSILFNSVTENTAHSRPKPQKLQGMIVCKPNLTFHIQQWITGA